MKERISIAVTGDVMLGRGVNEAIRRYGLLYPWGNTLDELRAADLTLINLECVIARGGRPWSRWPKIFHFKADPAAVEALLLAGVDGVSLANNHTLDFEEDAFVEMLKLLDSNHIAHAGAGRNIEEARRPALLETGGARIALICFTDNEPGWAASREGPGTNWIPISLSEQSLEPAREGIASAREAGADVVIFSIHWGPNMVERPSPLFREFARAVIDAGADVYLGHSAHIFQGVEIYRGRPIIYDAGDFVDDYAVDPALRNDWGFLFRLQLSGRSVRRVELIPTLIGRCQVNFATGAAREAIIERMRERSAEIGTAIRSEDDRCWIECRSDL
ncbi:MAG: Capsule biosynthesis protein CapA [Acidobacteria bacterium]|nr:Capsule biosynthesis protein CapA [Acidobacteriota bacterium]